MGGGGGFKSCIPLVGLHWIFICWDEVHKSYRKIQGNNAENIRTFRMKICTVNKVLVFLSKDVAGPSGRAV